MSDEVVSCKAGYTVNKGTCDFKKKSSKKPYNILTAHTRPWHEYKLPATRQSATIFCDSNNVITRPRSPPHQKIPESGVKGRTRHSIHCAQNWIWFGRKRHLTSGSRLYVSTRAWISTEDRIDRRRRHDDQNSREKQAQAPKILQSQSPSRTRYIQLIQPSWIHLACPVHYSLSIDDSLLSSFAPAFYYDITNEQCAVHAACHSHRP